MRMQKWGGGGDQTEENSVLSGFYERSGFYGRPVVERPETVGPPVPGHFSGMG